MFVLYMHRLVHAGSMVNAPFRSAPLVNELALRMLEKPISARQLTELMFFMGQINYDIDRPLLDTLERRLGAADYSSRDAGQLLRACSVLRYRPDEDIVASVMRPVLQVRTWRAMMQTAWAYNFTDDQKQPP